MASLHADFRKKRLSRTILNPKIRDGTLGADVLPNLFLVETDLEDTFSDGPGPLPIEADNETLGSAMLPDMILEDTCLEGTFWDEPASMMQSAPMQSAMILHPSTQSAIMQAPKQYLILACVHRANLGGRHSSRKSMLKSIADDLKQWIKTHLQRTRGTHGSLFVYKQEQDTNVLLDGHVAGRSMLLGLSDIADVEAVVAGNMRLRLCVQGGVQLSEYDPGAFARFSALYAPQSFERISL